MTKPSNDRSPLTRSGTRRLGDDFQDQIALEVLVDWLEHSDRYQWVQVEADDAGTLDDVVALRRDGGRRVRQVKYSTNPDLADDRLTWDMLLKQETGKTGKKATSWLQKWANTLLPLLPSATPIDAALDTNRQPSDEIKSVLLPTGLVDFDKIPTTTQAAVVAQLGTEAQARTFFANFRFDLNRPSMADLEDGLRRRFLARGGSELGWRSLKEEVGRWVCYREEPPPDGRITLADVKRAARWYRLQSLPQAFEVPPDYVLPSQAFHEQVLERLGAATAGCGMLVASPGSGKSTYASKLFGDLVAGDIPVVRHHYFLSLNDSNISLRLDHQRAAESLMHDLQRDHARALAGLVDDNPNPNDLRRWLEAVGRYYAADNKALVVIVDGLDHVWREQRSVDELERLLRMILPVPEGVFILLVSQPVDDSQLPPQLLRAVPRDRWEWLPGLDLPATTEWLRHHLSELPSGGEPFRQDDSRAAELAVALHRRSRGHPLHLRYTLRAVQEQGLPFTRATIDGLPDCPHEGITAYYEDLWRSLSDESRLVLHLFGSTNFAWPRSGLRECLDPGGRNIPSTIRAIKQVEHLLREDDLGLRPFHSSILAFVRELPDHRDVADELRRQALDWLNTKAPGHLRWAHAWTLAADLGDEVALLRGPDRAWTIATIAEGRPPSAVSSILARAIRIALRRRELPRSIELSLLLGYYMELQDGDPAAHLALLDTTLRIDPSPEVRAVLRNRIRELSDAEIVRLAEADAGGGEDGFGRRYARVLQDRLWGSRRRRNAQSQSSREGIDPLLAVAASLGTPSRDQVLGLVEANRQNGFATHIAHAYAEQLWLRRRAEGLRSLLTPTASSAGASSEGSTALTGDERLVVLRPLLLLGLEDGINCDQFAREAAAEPLAQIYAGIRKTVGFVPANVSFPAADILSVPEYNIHGRQHEVVTFFVQTFRCLLANCLWGKQDNSRTWLDQVGSFSWPREFVHLLDGLAASTAERLLSGRPISVDLMSAQLATLARPSHAGSDRDNFLYGVCAGKAVTELSFLLPILTAASEGRRTIGRAELEALIATGYCNRDYWLEQYVARRRLVLTPDALDWFVATAEADLNSSLSYFTDRANLYANLAAAAALHMQLEKARSLSTSAAANLLSYGYHKDMLFYHVLDSIRSYHASLVAAGVHDAESERWLCQLAGPIAFVGEYTDGDETGHFPRELASVLGEVNPTLLAAYHLWLCQTEQYYNAEYAFQEIVRVAELTDPILQAVARTASDDASLHVLAERHAKGHPGAAEAVDSLNNRLGHRPRIGDAGDSSTNTDLDELMGNRNQPNPAEFPPEKFGNYIDALRESKSYHFDEGVKAWIEHWRGEGRSDAAYHAVKTATEQGVNHWAYDEIYPLAVEAAGRDEGYRWLELANRKGHGWSRYRLNEETAAERWQVVWDHHPQNWYDFLRDTLLSDEPRLGRFVGHDSFGRVVRYLLLVGQRELARQLIDEMVKRSLELVSPLTFKAPGWVNAEERPNES